MNTYDVLQGIFATAVRNSNENRDRFEVTSFKNRDEEYKAKVPCSNTA